MVDRIREGSSNPDLCIACIMPWVTNSSNESTQKASLLLQRENYKFLKERVGLDVIIPVSTAVENLRTVLDNGHQLTRDNWHLCYGAGRYLAACSVYETLFAAPFGISMFDNPYLHPLTDDEKVIDSSNQYPGIDVDEEVALLCKKAVREAIKNPFVTTDLNNVD